MELSTSNQNAKDIGKKGIGEDEVRLVNGKPNNSSSRIIERFLLGDWQSFFDVWNTIFRSEIQESNEYKILTFKLRVHFAILPMRVIQLRQNDSNDPEKSEIVKRIFENVVEKFGSIDNEKDSEDEESKVIDDSMKQLEEFLNSCRGQKLAEELKGSSLKTLFALPYIINPQEDKSMSNIFTIDWLEKLIMDLENFTRNFVKQENLSTIETLDFKFLNGSLPNKNIAIQSLVTRTYNYVSNHKSKLSDISEEQISCERIIQSAIKSKEIEDWIANNKHNGQENESFSKSTQTYISSIKSGTGFVLISEPHYKFSITSPAVFSENVKQSISYKKELDNTKAQLFSAHKHYQKLKSRFHNLHEDYQKMNEIAEVLTIALENSVQGQPVNLDMILQSCAKIFPDRFNRDIQTDSEDTSIDLRDDLLRIYTVPNNKYKSIKVNPIPPELLDYAKIKNDLRIGNSRRKLLLLQALRHKITFTHQRNTNEIIREYVAKDLLELRRNEFNLGGNILSHILQRTHQNDSMHFIQQGTSRLLNTIASLSYGRTYLTSGPSVLNYIIKYLDSCNDRPGDAITLDMLLATLQKMSLRKEQRNYMIEANLVEWLIYHLSNENFRMGTYRLEYTCALLMNLSLHGAARSRASVIAPLFTSILTSLLSTDCISILPYVNSALQNFLLNDKINEEAKKLHLAEILEYHSIKNGDELKTHFLHTLKIHKRECDESLSDEDEFIDDNDDKIFDLLENELEEDDPIKSVVDELYGEILLATHYSLPTIYSEIRECQSSITQMNDSILRESKNSVLNRSTKVTSSETVTDDLKTESTQQIAEKKSGADIAQLPRRNEKNSWAKNEEAVFLAKPKLSRTPPTSVQIKMK